MSDVAGRIWKLRGDVKGITRETATRVRTARLVRTGPFAMPIPIVVEFTFQEHQGFNWPNYPSGLGIFPDEQPVFTAEHGLQIECDPDVRWMAEGWVDDIMCRWTGNGLTALRFADAHPLYAFNIDRLEKLCAEIERPQP